MNGTNPIVRHLVPMPPPSLPGPPPRGCFPRPLHPPHGPHSHSQSGEDGPIGPIERLDDDNNNGIEEE